MAWEGDHDVLIREKHRLQNRMYIMVTFKCCVAGRQWLTPVILATKEAEIRRIEV
jgi:hypothetical protein